MALGISPGPGPDAGRDRLYAVLFQKKKVDLNGLTLVSLFPGLYEFHHSEFRVRKKKVDSQTFGIPQSEI